MPEDILNDTVLRQGCPNSAAGARVRRDGGTTFRAGRNGELKTNCELRCAAPDSFRSANSEHFSARDGGSVPSSVRNWTTRWTTSNCSRILLVFFEDRKARAHPQA